MQPPHIQPASNNNGGPEWLLPHFNWWDRFLFVLAGTDRETMEGCPTPDHTDARATGLLVTFTWLYQAALFTLLGSRLFSEGRVSPAVLISCAFLATFVALIDIYMFNYSGNHQKGLRELKRGGQDLTGGLLDAMKSNCYLVVRLIMSIGLAQLTAIAFGLFFFSDDISARIDAVYREANAGAITEATTFVDAAIKRATNEVADQESRVRRLADQVNSLRQAEIDPIANDPQAQQIQREIAQLIERKAKADDDVQSQEAFAANESGGIRGAPGNSGQPGYGMRYHAAMQRVSDAKTHAQAIDNELSAARGRLDALREKLATADEANKQNSHDQLPTFETSLVDEQHKLQVAKDQLAELTEHRNGAIQTAVQSAPNFVVRNNGMLAQIKGLETVTHEDTWIAFSVFVIELVSLGFELGLVLCKTAAYVPTIYSARRASDAYLGVVRVVDEMTAVLDKGAANDNPFETSTSDTAANDNQSVQHAANGTDGFTAPGDPPATPKRKRGRPRKYPQQTSPKAANGQAPSGLRPDPPTPV